MIRLGILLVVRVKLRPGNPCNVFVPATCRPYGMRAPILRMLS